MKKGDLVTPKQQAWSLDPEPPTGIGVVLEVRYVNTVIVYWPEDGSTSWCELEEVECL